MSQFNGIELGDLLESVSCINEYSEGKKEGTRLSQKTSINLFFDEDAISKELESIVPKGEDPTHFLRKIFDLHFRAHDDQKILYKVEPFKQIISQEDFSVTLNVLNVNPSDALEKLGIPSDKVEIVERKKVYDSIKFSERVIEPDYTVTDEPDVELYHPDSFLIEGCYANSAIDQKSIKFDIENNGMSFNCSHFNITGNPINKLKDTGELKHIDPSSYGVFADTMKAAMQKTYGEAPEHISYSHEGYEFSKRPDGSGIKVSITFHDDALRDQFLAAFSLERDYDRAVKAAPKVEHEKQLSF